MGAHALARDAAGGVGGTQEGRDGLGLLLFDRGTNLRHDIPTEPLGHRQQSCRDLTPAFDGKRLRAEQLAAKSYSASEHRGLLRADRHGCQQTGELALGQDKLDYDPPGTSRRASTQCWSLFI